MLATLRIGFVCILLLLAIKFPYLSSSRRCVLILALLKLGGTVFVKLGQSLAVRVDVVGVDMASHLSTLQDRMPAFSYKQVVKSLEASFGKPVDKIFHTFDKMPVATASIAQVHCATTIKGDKVAVKILRPRIEQKFLADIKAFKFFATVLEKFMPSSRRLRPVQVVAEMHKWVIEEMNLQGEADNARRLSHNFADSDDFCVPKVYGELTTKTILTTAWIDGIRIDDKAGLIKAGLDPKDILEKSAKIFFLQVFRDGFFHADMHPGNMFVRADGVLCPVDFGIMGRLTKDTRIYVADVLYCMILQEYEKAAQVHFNAGYVPSTYSLSAFAGALKKIDSRVRDTGNWGDVSMGDLLGDLFTTTKDFNMKTRPELLLLKKTMVVAEGVGRTIAPNENMWMLIRPTMELWMQVNRGVGARAEHMLKGIFQSHSQSS